MKTVPFDNLNFTVENDEVVVRWFETEVARTPVSNAWFVLQDVQALVRYAAVPDRQPV